MADGDYTHRTTAQKLGVKPDQRVEAAGDVGPGLRIELKEALGRGLVRSGPLDGALVLVESLEEAQEAEFEREQAERRRRAVGREEGQDVVEALVFGAAGPRVADDDRHPPGPRVGVDGFELGRTVLGQ